MYARHAMNVCDVYALSLCTQVMYVFLLVMSDVMYARFVCIHVMYDCCVNVYVMYVCYVHVL